MQSIATPRFTLLCLLVLCVAASANAAPIVTINSIDGNTIFVSPNIPAVTGAMMSGMKVEATYANGSSSGMVIWKATGADSGGVVVPGWFSLTESGDTYGGNWILTNLNPDLGLTDLHICGACVGVYFDRAEPSPGTLTTENGWDWQWVADTTNGAVARVFVDYIDLVGNPALGDAYSRMDIVSIAAPLEFEQSMTFIADTDKFVPEPGTYQLIACGILGIAIYRLRRK